MESFKILPLEQQVSALKYSQRFKELRVKQDSLFYWCQMGEKKPNDWKLEYYRPAEKNEIWNCPEYLQHRLETPKKELHLLKEWKQEFVSAFTVAELGGMLPDEINGYEIACWKKKKKWGIAYYCAGMEVVDCNNYLNNKIELADTEANVRAKMLIYLLEKGDL